MSVISLCRLRDEDLRLSYLVYFEIHGQPSAEALLPPAGCVASRVLVGQRPQVLAIQIGRPNLVPVARDVARLRAVRSLVSSRSYSAREPRTPIVIRPAAAAFSLSAVGVGRFCYKDVGLQNGLSVEIDDPVLMGAASTFVATNNGVQYSFSPAALIITQGSTAPPPGPPGPPSSWPPPDARTAGPPAASLSPWRSACRLPAR